MDNRLEVFSKLSPLKRAYLALEKMQARLDAVENARREPIAIVGMGCRFPGDANSPESYWQLLRDGVDAITEVPADRWEVDTYYDPDPDAPGKMTTRRGGFLSQIDQFEPQLFNISPREAMSMDPQQRMLLEITWEALENAGQAPDRLIGSSTGVFLGIVNSDYSVLQVGIGESDRIDTYFGSGSAHSIASGRLSYVFGLNGPSISVDTACSSSLVAVHLAVQSLRNGECRLALAAGVNAMVIPETTISLSKYRMLAPDGRCKAFDARADGFVRGEGCGVVVLKRLSDALADGDHIWALICGTAANQDGPSSGLTAPNGPAQEAVIRQALANAAIDPTDVTYVETHGTGTSLGDPIEVQALGAVLGKGRESDRPLLIGSVKTNIGHLESSAGIAGLIKMALVLRNREIPPHLHLQEKNPLIPWDKLPIEIPTTRTPWPEGAPLIGGVSSFGFSGTNVHVVMEARPEHQPAQPEVERPLHLLTLSARDEKALQELAGRHEAYLAGEGNFEPFPDVAFTANAGRAQLPNRLAIVAESSGQTRKKLVAFARGESPVAMAHGHAQSSGQPQVAFLFTGQGAQYVGMGRQLYQTQPTFRETLDRCDALLGPYLEKPLLSVLYADEASGISGVLNETIYTQPALFVIEVALAEFWRSCGVRPDVVMGHSIGEYAAACVAGVFTLEDGLRLIAERGRLMQALPAGGEMAAVFANEATVADAISPYGDEVAIAAVNGPSNVVISGVGTAVQSILNELEASGIKNRRLEVSHAFHSPLMEPMLNAFEKTAAQITYNSPRIKFISNVTGRPAKRSDLTSAQYWRDHVRRPVRFADGMEALSEQGVAMFVEIGPRPTLLGMGQRCLLDNEAIWLPSLRKGRDDWQQLLQSVGTLFVNGVDMDWEGFDRDYHRHRVPLPTYPFQRKRYWIAETAGLRSKSLRHHAISESAVHPLLGHRLASPMKAIQFENSIDPATFSFLADHLVYGATIMPATAYIEIALAAAKEVLGSGSAIVHDLLIHEALVLAEDETKTVQVIVTPGEDDTASFQIHSANIAGSDGHWRLHASGQVKTASDGGAPEQVSLDEIRARCLEERTAASHYDALAERGLHLGDSLQGVVHIWRRDGEALAEIKLPEILSEEESDYQIHPALLDICLQPFVVALRDDGDNTTTFLPSGLESFRLSGRLVSDLWSHITIQPPKDGASDTLVGNVRLLDRNGRLVAEMTGLSLRRTQYGEFSQIQEADFRNWLYDVVWQPHSTGQNAFVETLPTPNHIAGELEPQIEAISQEQKLHLHHELVSSIDAIAVAYIVDAFRQMGWTFSPGEGDSVDELITKLGVVDQHRRLFERLLLVLAEEQIVEQIGDEWTLRRPLETTNTQEMLAKLREKYSDSQPQIVLAERCGEELANVLIGQMDPLQLLFPGGSLEVVERLYQESPEANVYNTLAAKAMATAVAERTAGQTIRILEIGAGTGGATSSVLPVLPPDQTEYYFTDISPLLVAKAKEKFAAYPFIQYQVLDIEQDPGEQGMTSGQFDIVLAANVLHATADLKQTLHHIRELMAPGGLLLLLEETSPKRWIDITFGMTDGWWRFIDTDLRPSYPLLSRQGWTELLAAQGFADVRVIPETPTLSDQALVVARLPHLAEAQDAPGEPSYWVLLADKGGVGRALCDRLQMAGDNCILVSPGAAYQEESQQQYKLDPTRPEDFSRLLLAVGRDNSLSCKGVIYLWGMDIDLPENTTTEALEASQLFSCGSLLYLSRALVDADRSGPSRLWIVTRGAQPASPAQTMFSVAQAPLWGLGRVVALEHPEIWGGMVDLEEEVAEDESALLLAAFHDLGDEDQIAIRDGQHHVARLVRHDHHVLDHSVTWRADGAYLITGGLGNLGPSVALWMADKGAKHVILTTRREFPVRSAWEKVDSSSEIGVKIATIQEIEELGTKVKVVQTDVSDLEQMSSLLEELRHTSPPLRGIIHAAGVSITQAQEALNVNALEPIRGVGADMLRQMFQPKVSGSWILHQLSQDLDLDFLVFFSTAAATWGSKGMGIYAAANQFLDGLTHYRRAHGLPALSINWARLGTDSADLERFFAEIGLETMQTEKALAAFEYLLEAHAIQGTVAAVDWDVFKPVYEAKRRRPFLDQVSTPTHFVLQHDQEGTEDNLVQKLEKAHASERLNLLVDHIRHEAMQILGFEPSQYLDPQQGLFEMGMDSLMAVELRGRLEKSVQHPLSPTMTFDYPTIEAIAVYLAGEILQQDFASTAPVEPSKPVPQADDALDQLEQLSEDEIERVFADYFDE